MDLRSGRGGEFTRHQRCVTDARRLRADAVRNRAGTGRFVELSWLTVMRRRVGAHVRRDPQR